jgi:hypothetical protein
MNVRAPDIQEVQQWSVAECRRDMFSASIAKLTKPAQDQASTGFLDLGPLELGEPKNLASLLAIQGGDSGANAPDI